jgi:hypothetical protein
MRSHYYPRLCDRLRRAPNDCAWGVGLFHFGHCNDASSSPEILRNRFRDNIGWPRHDPSLMAITFRLNPTPTMKQLLLLVDRSLWRAPTPSAQAHVAGKAPGR